MPLGSQLSRTPSDSKLSTEHALGMTDIQQWRRRIQPSRARNSIPYGDHEDLSTETVSSPITPRKKVRPKLSSYFSHYKPAIDIVKPEVLSADYTYSPPHSTSSEAYNGVGPCQPEAEGVMESMMTAIMVNPLHELDTRDNISLMMIFEAYRSLCDQNAAQSDKLRSEMNCRFAAEIEAERAEKRWEQEREDYKTEIRRLELLIAKGKRGLVDVIRARQDSILRRKRTKEETVSVHDHKETVLEFLERIRVDDCEARKAQKAFWRPLPVSPSHKMAALSHKFSIAGIHGDAPLRSPPRPEEHFSLSHASQLERELPVQGPNIYSMRESVTQSVNMSGESISTFSSFGDLLPDEVSGNVGPHCSSDEVVVTAFKVPTVTTGRESANSFSSRHSEDEYQSPDNATTPHVGHCLDRGSKVPGQRPRPTPLQIQHERRFSFDAGDDPGFELPNKKQRVDSNNSTVAGRSISLSGLDQEPSGEPRDVVGLKRLETPKVGTMSSPMMSPSQPILPGLSKIPSPIFDNYRARPRREDSNSSFLTAMRRSDTSVPQSDRSSQRSVRSSETAETVALDESHRSSSESHMTTGGKRLVHDKTSLRCNQVGNWSARLTDAMSTLSSASEGMHDQRGRIGDWKDGEILTEQQRTDRKGPGGSKSMDITNSVANPKDKDDISGREVRTR